MTRFRGNDATEAPPGKSWKSLPAVLHDNLEEEIDEEVKAIRRRSEETFFQRMMEAPPGRIG